ncbi:MAG: ATP-binding cassette domain-containing protein [Cyclobacteriaceae bacterium]
MSKPLIEAEEIGATIGSRTILQDITFAIYPGQAWAITGWAGSGKTTLAKIIANRFPVTTGHLTNNLPPSTKVVIVEQQHRYKNQIEAAENYYQARYESLSSEDFPTVEDTLLENLPDFEENEQKSQQVEEVLKLLQIIHLKNVRLIQLSNGENKRFQLSKALLQNPKMLILDNPFVGLDQETRTALHEIINHLIVQGIIVILITSPNEIPKRITHVIELQQGRSVYTGARLDFLKKLQTQNTTLTVANWIGQERLAAIPPGEHYAFDVAVRMDNVTVRYGDRIILDGVNWQVKRGEKWGLSGPNGAGKSTLLSLINGDNPQAYSNKIYLFDRKKGSGESIWDIKRRIGYVSPELHLYFDRRVSCADAIASGLIENMHSPKNFTATQQAAIAQWLDIFQFTPHKEKLLRDMPLSEQRLVLLARALVKNPPFLILDEPCQGLDRRQTQRFTAMVDAICQHFDKTLIYVSHYSEEIPDCVEQTLYLKEGKVVR